MEIKDVSKLAQQVIDNVSDVIVGKQEQASYIVTALLANCHVLLDDVPGTGKTMMARSVAQSLGLKFSRIQFTPDLLPSDVTGLYYYNQHSQQFEFRPGPIMAGVVLADEINRATPRTQSSLLEAMQEGQTTIDGTTHRLDRPFFVLATQNPVEMEGTFPLPEAQLDRFGINISLGYPSIDEEDDVLTRFKTENPLDNLQPVTDPDQILSAQETVRTVHVGADTRLYLLTIINETRNKPEILLGGSPRASQILYRCAQALAAIQERAYVLPDDVKTLAAPVLTHRLLLRSRVQLRGHSASEVLSDIVNTIPVPTERERGPGK